MQCPHLVVELLEDLCLHVAENLGPVGDEELATALSGGVEANKGTICGRLLECRLIVEANVVLGEGLLVHLCSIGFRV